MFVVGQFWLYFDFYALRRSEWAIIPENVCLHLKFVVGQFWLYFDFYALRRSEWAIIPENVCLHLKENAQSRQKNPRISNIISLPVPHHFGLSK